MILIQLSLFSIDSSLDTEKLDQTLSDLRSVNSRRGCVIFSWFGNIFLFHNVRLAVNKKGSAATKASARSAKGKAAKDPNKPKRPPSAFFVFM